MTQIDKVTAFIVRQRPDHVPALLLLRHPYAGIQIPAGTVEPGEDPSAAVLREAREETGLEGLSIQKSLGARREPPPAGEWLVALETPVYSRPDPGSFAWARFRPGITVRLLRRAPGYRQVSYIEPDRYPGGRYITYAITGWTPAAVLTRRRRRHFFLLDCTHETPESWQAASDGHHFELFWAPLDPPPPVVAPQAAWLEVLRPALAAG
jgi:8-oxo-dGTP pyrophosphatase MutT (NUDIX family)